MTNIHFNINNIDELELNINTFSQLSKEMKLDFLDKIKKEKTEIMGQFLNRIYLSENDKQIQKVIKKLLFHLKTVGIKVEESKIKGESVLKKYEEKREHRAMISNYDGDGTRMAMIAFETKKHAYVLVHGLLHFSKGLMELGNVPIDEMGLRQITTQGSLKPFIVAEVSPRYVHYLLEEASNVSGRYVEEIRQMKSFSFRLGGEVQKPDDIYTLAIPNDTVSLSFEQILSDDLFDPFCVTWDTIDDDKKEYSEIGTSSTIVLPPYLVEEKRHIFIRNLIENGKLSPNLILIKRLMEDYAYIFYTQNELRAYKGLIELLQQSDGLSKTLAFFVKKVLEDTNQQPAGLIVNPYEQVRPPR